MEDSYNLRYHSVRFTFHGVPERESSLEGIRVAAWFRPEQDDLFWYEARRVGKGRYCIDLDQRNHCLALGKYYLHVYSVHQSKVSGEKLRFEAEFRPYIFSFGSALAPNSHLLPSAVERNGFFSYGGKLSLFSETIKETNRDIVRKLKEKVAGMLRRNASDIVLNGELQDGRTDVAFMKNPCEVLFINGNSLAAKSPTRYRIDHQMEQLASRGVSVDAVFWCDLEPIDAKRADVFVLFRAPGLQKICDFVDLVQSSGKKVFFDVDDLVIDTEYTENIALLRNATMSEREGFQQGVENIKKALLMCDFGNVSTTCLQQEMKRYLSEVSVNRNVASMEMVYRSQAILRKHRRTRNDTVVMGYFSGSMTHNDDFISIVPALAVIMEKYSHVALCVVGDLDVPRELESYSEKIITLSKVDYRDLPELISLVDINIVPLEDSLFNRAKSENKWVEAALVQCPTVASDVGALAEMIENGKTGLLCRSMGDWVEKLGTLIEDEGQRRAIGLEAYRFCMMHCISERTGEHIESVLSPFFSSDL